MSGATSGAPANQRDRGAGTREAGVMVTWSVCRCSAPRTRRFIGENDGGAKSMKPETAGDVPVRVTRSGTELWWTHQVLNGLSGPGRAA